MTIDQRAFSPNAISLGSTTRRSITRSDYRNVQNAGTRDRSNVATVPSNPNMTRGGVIQTERGSNGSGGYRMDQDGNVERSRSVNYSDGQPLIDRISKHVQAIMVQGFFTENDQDIRLNNLILSRQYGRYQQAKQLYDSVQLLKESGPLTAGFDLPPFVKDNWEIIAAVGGVMLLIKFIKSRNESDNDH